MNLTACRTCAQQVAAEAHRCPACGVRNPGPKRHRTRQNIQAVVVLGLFALLLYVLAGF